MTLFNRFVAGLRGLIWKTRVEREMDDELREYWTRCDRTKCRRA